MTFNPMLKMLLLQMTEKTKHTVIFIDFHFQEGSKQIELIFLAWWIHVSESSDFLLSAVFIENQMKTPRSELANERKGC